jgi:hypothetical protein
MEYKTLDEIGRVARAVSLESGIGRMSRRERLERWATVLERYEGRLRALMRIEYLSQQERIDLRGEDTPLTVAYRDPVLRAEGLTSDRLGSAMAFFHLSERAAHHLLCDCHYQGTITAAGVAAQVRSLANRVTLRELWDRARNTVTGWR